MTKIKNRSKKDWIFAFFIGTMDGVSLKLGAERQRSEFYGRIHNWARENLTRFKVQPAGHPYYFRIMLVNEKDLVLCKMRFCNDLHEVMKINDIVMSPSME